MINKKIAIFALTTVLLASCGVNDKDDMNEVNEIQKGNIEQNKVEDKNIEQIEDKVLNKIELEKDFVSFDKAYIPLLGLTSQGKVDESKKSMKILRITWDSFKEKNTTAFNDDTLTKVDTLINGAERIVDSGTGIIKAHEDYLEDIRIIFMDSRENLGINDYYIDLLTKFHKPMEDIVLAGKGKNLETFTEENLKTITEAYPFVLEKFISLKDGKFDTVLFGFNEEKEKARLKVLDDEEQSLINLKSAIDNGDKEEIIKTAVLIKPNFAKLFMMFGNFESLKNN